MSELPVPAPKQTSERVRRGFEYVLFNSRWLLAPFYVGLVVALAVLLLKFLRMLAEFIVHAPGAKSTETILERKRYGGPGSLGTPVFSFNG